MTVPFYSNKEYLSALAYYTHHNIFAPNLQVQDLLGKSFLSCGCWFAFLQLYCIVKITH